MKALTCRIRGVGILGPGLPDWSSARAVLAGSVPHEAVEPALSPPAALPANERRRTTALVRLALAVAAEALDGHAGEFASVFASSEGDLFITDHICRALLMPERPVSPTLFHNSVHNAPAGYLSIACRNRAPYTSISAVDETVAAGLLEAVTQLVTEARDVLLLAYDAPPPEPLKSARPISGPFGAALLLAPASDAADGPRLTLEALTGEASPSVCEVPSLETLRQTSPSARILPLLAALAGAAPQTVVLPASGGKRLRMTIAP